MKTKRTTITPLVLAALLLCGWAPAASANDVEARLSTREAYVGMPVILQISINNAEDYQQPVVPEIDGCDIRFAGAPSQSSQITIINGRRSASRSITMQYLITPRRTGTFEIPSITVSVDGRDLKTRPQRFVATKSDTGDLMFAEIVGGKEKVFVGQPLDLTLKIWIKPFQDRDNNIKLSEAHMWQTISPQTSWGSFSDRLNELAENNQRAGGQEVLRDDGQGNQRSYYLYEIDATVYPKRPGKIDADDVQIVARYPTALGKSKDPFESFFRDSPFGGRDPFGGRSLLSQMMNDDPFSAPFGNRLAVSSTRPIIAQAAVDSTEVIPVPAQGRPADYRGAVGRYRIVTQATPTAVSAGDPITLKIGIAGTGPMELVQAPPLAQSKSLTTDFKVTNEPLAGFVQDETKVFSTTVRPRREGITEIPPISFSFFNPKTAKFETVMSDPISINVDKAESLALDEIVGKARHGDNEHSGMVANETFGPEFSNHDSSGSLDSQTAPSTVGWWWMFVACPPLVWLAILLVRNRQIVVKRLPSFQSPSRQCLNIIGSATDRSNVTSALVLYIARRTGTACQDATNAVGALRTFGLYSVANDVESFLFSGPGRQEFHGAEPTLLDTQQSARELVERMESSFAEKRKSSVRKKHASDRSGHPSADRNSGLRLVNETSRKIPVLFFLAIAVTAAGTARANEHPSASDSVASNQSTVTLTRAQQETILQEASQAYARASELSDSDSAESRELFTIASNKYQLLVNSGICNSQLYLSLGNAYLQAGKTGHAIANYELARCLDPGNRQLFANLEFANSLVEGQDEEAANAEASDLLWSQSIVSRLRSANELVVNLIGSQAIIWMLVVSSLLFWGVLIARAFFRFPVWRFAVAPLLVLSLSIVSSGISGLSNHDLPDGVIVADNITLHTGDGEQFDAVRTLETSQGHRVHILAERGNWIRIRTSSGDDGWIRNRDLVVINDRQHFS